MRKKGEFFFIGLRCLISIWLIGSLLLPPCTAGQQPAPSDWQRVRNLPPHTTIVVQTKTRDRYHGELVNATADSLSLDSDERAFPGRIIRRRDLRQTDVREIRLLNRGASALTGAAIGAAAGASVGLAIDLSARSNEDRGLATGLFISLGTLLGWAIGRHTTVVKGEKIYVAP